jgi:nitrite reductase/ring-hydroxylating ferredoxin subunit
MAEYDGVQDDCAGCPLAGSRREFLRDSAGAVLAALATLGLTRSASALPIRWLTSAAIDRNSISYAIPAGNSVSIDRHNEVILVRWDNAVYAFALSCPHQNTALRWLEADGRFQCPKHKSKYRPDGTFMSGRATRGMDRYSLQRQQDMVVVDVATLHKQTDDPDGWTAAVIHLS